MPAPKAKPKKTERVRKADKTGKAVRDIGIDVQPPKKKCTDKNCPFHGRLPVRGQIIEGVVASDKMDLSIVVSRTYHHYISKYERYEKRKARYLVHNPPCLELKVGDKVTIMECRPLSKHVAYVAVEKKR
jgi:small subunit ribosomal protein S17